MRLSRKKTKRVRYCLFDGPFAGEIAYLPEETMVFSAKGMKGRYVIGRWESVR